MLVHGLSLPRGKAWERQARPLDVLGPSGMARMADVSGGDTQPWQGPRKQSGQVLWGRQGSLWICSSEGHPGLERVPALTAGPELGQWLQPSLNRGVSLCVRVRVCRCVYECGCVPLWLGVSACTCV